MSKPIYMDYNATAPLRACALEAWQEAVTLPGNPSSVHAAGRKAARFLEESRAKVAGLVNARPRDIVFTSGGTEANNAVIRQTGAKSLLVSAIEHESILAAAKASGLTTTILPVDSVGHIQLDAFEKALSVAESPCLVSVMLVNNETGTIQPMEDIAALAQRYNARLHIDAIQAAGKLPLDCKTLGADYLTLSAHKIGGPQGVGAIVLSPTAPLTPLIAGGGQELGRRSGTENVAGIFGFGAAALEAMASLGDMQHIGALRDTLERAITKDCPDAIIIAKDGKRVANTSCIALPGISGETQVMHFDLAGICVSSGSACSSGKVKVSHVLSALGYDQSTANASIRVSLGWESKSSDIDAFVKAYKALYTRTAERRSEGL